MVKDILIKEFDYPLPDEAIARFPLQKRDECKLIVSDPDRIISHHSFLELPDLLPKDALMIYNETKVINARMDFQKSTGSHIEIFLLEPTAPSDYAVSFASRSSCRWSCLVGNLKRWKHGNLTKDIIITDKQSKEEKKVTLSVSLLSPLPGNAREIEFSWNNPDVTFADIVEVAGNIPIPPYLNRESMESDTHDYQTVFSRVSGSVAAPTAGLHFTDNLLDKLVGRGVRRLPVVLHVGAGTFQPVKSESIGEHPMHTETFTISRQLVEELIEALDSQHQIVAVGTTSVRTLESLPILGARIMNGDVENLHIGQWDAYSAEFESSDTVSALKSLLGYMDGNGLESLTASTAIMIAPGFRWRIVKRMVTNFHQPQSTLLLLVSSFLEPAQNGHTLPTHWRRIYEEALAKKYRFLSYGDACLLSPVKNL